MNGNIRRLGIVFVIIFSMISIDLVYWQVIDAGSLNAHAGNPRQLTASTRVVRGRILDRNGVVLVGRRVYRGGFVQPLYHDPTLAQTLGYHSIRFTDAGLEASLSSYLTGTSGTSWSQVYNSWLHRPIHGDDVYLTIDERIQQAAATAIQTEVSAAGLPSTTPAAAVAFDPRNGQILASVSRPYFNATCLDSPNQSQEQTCLSGIEAIPGSALINRVTQGLYPPGSTFKTLTLSAAIDSAVQSLSSQYNGQAATGPLTIDGFTIPASGNNLPAGVTSVDLLHAFMYSDNIVFAQVGLKLGAHRFIDYAHRFLLGHSIPFDLPVSISDVLSPGENFDRVALASSAFGQGRDHLTPLQMLLIAGTIADGGRMPKPILVKSIKTPGGTVVGGDPSGTIASPINGATAAQVRHAMVEVVNAGSGVYAQILGVKVAGKTGTAQTGTSQAPDAWFIAFAPADHPRIAVAVIVENGGEGAYVAAPIAKQILEAGLQYVH